MALKWHVNDNDIIATWKWWWPYVNNSACKTVVILWLVYDVDVAVILLVVLYLI